MPPRAARAEISESEIIGDLAHRAARFSPPTAPGAPRPDPRRPLVQEPFASECSGPSGFATVAVLTLALGTAPTRDLQPVNRLLLSRCRTPSPELVTFGTRAGSGSRW